MLIPSAPGTDVKKNSDASIDYSNRSEGYVTISYQSDPAKKSIVVITHVGSGKNQKFAVPSDGESRTFPLCYGDGMYQFAVYRQVVDTRYSQILTLFTDVKLRTEYVPWLYTNSYSWYTPESKCVKLAAEICAGLKNDIDKVRTIYHWIVDHVEYDRALAVAVTKDKWWRPDPDLVASLGQSICFGYASLKAAMCRSLEIPCKICVGYAGASWHAWSEIYTEHGGDVDGIEFLPNKWNRHDVTFMDSSRGSAREFVRNDKNYTTHYCG